MPSTVEPSAEQLNTFVEQAEPALEQRYNQLRQVSVQLYERAQRLPNLEALDPAAAARERAELSRILVDLGAADQEFRGHLQQAEMAAVKASDHAIFGRANPTEGEIKHLAVWAINEIGFTV